ncbi:hypothetical protein BDZ45DRAFT_801399 [Acephala macrosclerotiorum]|nr:hypothetical protein BDZ45DRAFT_801399 [Acephala macrosclerotiorum]
MSRIQSSNIANLCTKLGFPPDGEQESGEIESRDPKELKRALSSFRIRFAEQGHPLPFSDPYSPEAEKYALAFCEEDDRAEKYWPPNTYGWPCWATDKTLILRSLTHMFGLQAYYQYQREGKAKKKATSPALSSPYTEDYQRDLSPESLQYVGPSPPKGTKRRPNKKPSEEIQSAADMGDIFSTQDINNAAVGPEVHQACKEEIDSLDPRRGDRPIREFTTQWLIRAGSRWPVQADARVRTFMHENDYYDAGDDSDHKVMQLIKNLRSGTEIEECEHRHYIILKQRLLERIGVEARQLLAKGLLERSGNGRLQKSLCFRDYWQDRQSSWGPAPSAQKKAPSKRPSVFDVPSDEETVQSSSFQSRKAQRLPGKKTNTERPSATRKADETLDDIYGASPPPNKRQRLNTNATPPRRTSPSPPPSGTITVAVTNGLGGDQAAATDPETNGHIEFAKKVLSAVDDPVPSNSVTDKDSPSTTNNVPTSSRAAREDKSEKAAPVVQSNVQQPVQQPYTAAPGSLMTPRTTPNLNAPRVKQRLVLILQKSARDLDLDYENTLSAPHLRDSSVAQFFQLYSERSNVPLQSLDCLTFTFMFALGHEMVIRQGDDVAWRQLKEMTPDLFTLQRRRNQTKEEFKVVVEIGDKKTGVLPVADDDLWGE